MAVKGSALSVELMATSHSGDIFGGGIVWICIRLWKCECKYKNLRLLLLWLLLWISTPVLDMQEMCMSHFYLEQSQTRSHSVFDFGQKPIYVCVCVCVCVCLCHEACVQCPKELSSLRTLVHGATNQILVMVNHYSLLNWPMRFNGREGRQGLSSLPWPWNSAVFTARATQSLKIQLQSVKARPRRPATHCTASEGTLLHTI